ncbi:hypothetical protein BGX21_003162 [Mortierella sp. AD011]|nr:hypothetical protein BGX20_003139 [Mortierella sp. AD010]KAF9377565.1 hypothetical protein BGX21_003162 [Mortierella sp. AD011]
MDSSDASDRTNTLLHDSFSDAALIASEQESKDFRSPAKVERCIIQVEDEVPTFTEDQRSADLHHTTELASSTFSNSDASTSASVKLKSPLPGPPTYNDLLSPRNSSAMSATSLSNVPAVPESATTEPRDEDEVRTSSTNPPSQTRTVFNSDHLSVSQLAHPLTPPSMPAPVYRYLPLDDDELPGYIPVAENCLTFKLLASQSTTYTVIPSQGPSEFREQGPRLRNQNINNQGTLSRTASRGIPGPDTTQHPDIQAVVHERSSDVLAAHNPHQTGAWTLEYWVNDTIAYLCYLMDPYFPINTDLPQNHSIEQIQMNLTPGRRAEDIELRALRGSHVTREGGNEVQSQNEHRMEGVHTRHLRGRPPPLNRTRNVTLRQYRPDGTTLHISVAEDRPVTDRIDATAALPPISEASSSPPLTSLVPAAPALTTASAGASSMESPETEADISTVTSSEERHREDLISPQGAAPVSTLPSIQHVQINDGYQGEEADAILAHAVNIQDSHNDTEENMEYNGEFNNALAPAFFKSPTFAFVSADDPQTWIWWSAHHESNLQKCRMEHQTGVVVMWWRKRTDFYSKVNKEKRKRDKATTKQMKAESGERGGLKALWHRLLSLQSSESHHQDMEIFMRVRGLHYAWREEDYGSRQSPIMSPLHQHQNPRTTVHDGAAPSYDHWKATPRIFALIRDDSFVMGRQLKGDTVAEVWIEGEAGPSISSASTETALDNHPHSRNSRAFASRLRSSSLAGISVHSSETQLSSSFPGALRKRRCVIRVAQGLHTEVETFALSTGPRLIELYDLYTEQSVPGPSRISFFSAVGAFAILFIVAFLSTILARNHS